MLQRWHEQQRCRLCARHQQQQWRVGLAGRQLQSDGAAGSRGSIRTVVGLLLGGCECGEAGEGWAGGQQVWGQARGECWRHCRPLRRWRAGAGVAAARWLRLVGRRRRAAGCGQRQSRLGTGAPLLLVLLRHCGHMGLRQPPPGASLPLALAVLPLLPPQAPVGGARGAQAAAAATAAAEAWGSYAAAAPSMPLPWWAAGRGRRLGAAALGRRQGAWRLGEALGRGGAVCWPAAY